MLMWKDRRPSYRTIEGWAIGILLAAGAVKECPDHGYIQCRGDPDARDRAFTIAREHPMPDCSQADAIAAVHDVLGGIGDACPEC
jgi:hypothetical protein